MSELYELRHAIDQSTNYSVCVCQSNSPWFYTCWSLGRKLDDVPNVIIEFVLEGKSPLEDFQMTNADHVLVSDKLFQILKASEAKFDWYESIITKKGKIIDTSFKVINFTESFWCMKKSQSIYKDSRDVPGMVRNVEKLVISRPKLPKQKIFRLGENTSILLANNDFKVAVESEKLTGLRFCEVEVSST